MIRLLEDGFDDGYESVSRTRVLETSRSDSIEANRARGVNENLQTETPSDMSTMVRNSIVAMSCGCRSLSFYYRHISGISNIDSRVHDDGQVAGKT
jgi:hypothetical protein